MAEGFDAPVVVHVVRDGFIESVHRGHVAAVSADGTLLAGLGDPHLETYPRSALKPFQTAATLGLLAGAGVTLQRDSVAIATGSHDGSATHQIEAAYLLALAGLDESALQCPPAFAADEHTRADQHGVPVALAHNCSGKHAAFLLAHTLRGGDPAEYLDLGSDLQQRVADEVSRACGTALSGPSLDGCGAPAWRMPLSALALGFARLAGGLAGLLQIRDAMRGSPELVGGPLAVDTALMRADARVVAKRGAEAVLAAGYDGPNGPVGVAVKIADGGARGCGPIVAEALRRAGMTVPDGVLRPTVLGGGRPHGAVELASDAAAALGAPLL